MKDKLIELVQMTAVLFPMYKKTLATFQEECEYNAHLIEGCALDVAISTICELPMMVDIYDIGHREFLESLLLAQIAPEQVH